MPTVRELKNRITFDVNKASVANAENVFGKLKKGSKSVISIIKGVGAAIVGVTALASKQFIELEKDIGATNFFSRSKKDAEDLLRLTQEIAKISVTTSKKEAGQASAILSQIPGIEQFRNELLPILEEISVANPKLDFTGVTQAFSDLVKDGNLAELKNLLPGAAELLEKLSLSTFNFGDRTKTAANRAQLFLEQMQKQRGELKRLADEQRKTERFQAEGVAKETSDFITNFGATTAGPMTELFKELRLTIKEINDSEGFWENVKISSEVVLATFKAIRSTIKLLSGDEEEEQKAFEKGKKTDAAVRAFFKKKKTEVTQFLLEPPKGKEDAGPLGFLGDILSTPAPKDKTEGPLGFFTDVFKNINVSGKIEVDVKGADNVDGQQLTTNISSQVANVLKEKLRNVAAQNGRAVGTGGGF